MWGHLNSGNWLLGCDNYIIVGMSGSGKTSLAAALGNLACHKGYRTYWARTRELLNKLKELPTKDLDKQMVRFYKIHCLILDDFLIEGKPDERDVQLLYRILDGRDSKHPTIFVTQLKTEGLEKLIGKGCVADGLKNRIIGPSHIIEVIYDEGRTPSANIS